MRALPLLLILPLLAGCSGIDWASLTHFGSDSRPPARAASPSQVASQELAAAPAPAQPPNEFCLAVAKQDATENGFDTATQQKVAVRSYQQCVQLFGGTR